MKTNGQTPKPAIAIFWDNDSQQYNFIVDPEQLKNPEISLAVLGMCYEKAKFNVNAINMQVLQQEMMQEAQTQAMARRIIGG